MNKSHLLLMLTMFSTPLIGAEPTVSLTVGEGFANPIGFHDSSPVFSWKLPGGVAKQSAYRIEVRGDDLLWDSGWIESVQSVFVPYGGKPLVSGQQATWRVDYRDETGTPSGWSKPASLELGLLSAKDWSAKWIRPAGKLPELESASWLRREFPIKGEVSSARLHVTARGLFEVYLNGSKVGRDTFAPGWTSYANRIDTLTYDVTSSLKTGPNGECPLNR